MEWGGLVGERHGKEAPSERSKTKPDTETSEELGWGDMVGGRVGWRNGWMEGWQLLTAIVDAYIASIAIRIMSDTRDEEQAQDGERDKIEVCCRTPKI